MLFFVSLGCPLAGKLRIAFRAQPLFIEEPAGEAINIPSYDTALH